MTVCENRYKAVRVFCILVVFLGAAVFFGCEDTEKYTDEKTSSNGLEVGEMTFILPGNVALTMVKVEAGTFEMSVKDGENDSDEVAHQATLTRDFTLAGRR